MRGHARPCVMCFFNVFSSASIFGFISTHHAIWVPPWNFSYVPCASMCVAFRMYSPALTAPSSACMCWSFGDPWYLCYLADCICQRLVTPLKYNVCASVCRLVCYEADRLRGHMVKPSQVDSKPVLMLNIRPCLQLIRCSPYTILWIWDHMTTDHMRWYFILNN